MEVEAYSESRVLAQIMLHSRPFGQLICSQFNSSGVVFSLCVHARIHVCTSLSLPSNHSFNGIQVQGYDC